MTRETPRELTIEEVEQVIEAFAQAALRAQKAGFEAVEVLSGTGYLISEFLSPLTNQRKDEYGGPLENRMRFGLKIMRAVRRMVGENLPLIVRMNGNDFMPGGQGRGELQEYAKALVQNGVDALCINVGWHEAKVPQIVSFVPRAVFAYLARGIKELVDVPVIASHRINDPTVARQLISDGMCDMVAMGRSLIADPYLPEKTRNGKEDEIVHCVACAQGCFDHLFELKSIECLCNPKAGHEGELRIERAKKPKKVMVVGGGPAGMSAALAANERGHSVTLYERSDRLGGQLFLAAAPPGRQEFLELAKDLRKQVALKGIRVVLNQDVDAELLERESPDAVILATGAVPLTFPIPGADGPNVVQAWDVLEDKVVTGRRVVIIGGGAVGVETALFLAEKGTLSGDELKFLLVNKAEDPDTLYQLATRGTKKIVLIEMINKIGKDIGRSTRWGMLQDMTRFGVKADVETRAVEITENGVKVEYGGAVEEIPADTVVTAGGAESFNPLQKLLEEKGIPFRVAGDAGRVATAFDAVHGGFAAGREI
ncbi:MAG: NADH:flavin oxidoreductase [Actinobacteria bacterium RBG_13_63_9]|nr:MAG: NADH:flavin oxidoreductase [Actinobacteria bacterium RBG_13_63_9]